MATPALASTTLLDTLTPRPPTPPRECHRSRGPLLTKHRRRRSSPRDPQRSLQTPPNVNSPRLPAAQSDLESNRKRKKVEWSTHTDYSEPIVIGSSLSQPPRPSPSSTAPKPVKGILKPSLSSGGLSSSLGSELGGEAGPANIYEMLDSAIRQLAGADRTSKLDAYMMLSRALKASNNLPDRVALQDKMSLLTQFIQRDVLSRKEEGGLDTSLVNHALTLLATFLLFPAIASTISQDFAVFIVDYAIRSFEDVSLPKDVVRHLMQIIAFQNFSSKVMSSDRIGRLISSLHAIEGHMRGKSIVMSRIQIYKRLVKQAPTLLAAHSSWLKDLFTDMLSSIKDIRAQAISLGLEAGFSLRHDKNVLRKVAEILQTADNDQTYIEFYIGKLQEMVKDREHSAAVPQIWSVVLLFLRCPLERWQYYGPWLTLAQNAFNSPDVQTKQEANHAWNRYVYVSLHDSKPSTKLLSTLCQPFVTQVRKKLSHKEDTQKLRRTVMSGASNLYYYAFKPSGDRIATDTIWDVAVQPVIMQLTGIDGKADLSGDLLTYASKILTGLFDVTTSRVWREDRIMDLPPVKMEEIPALDSKWIRRNPDKVFHCISPVLERKVLELSNTDSLTYRLWQTLVGSVASASSKDIKVSDDTVRFSASALNLLLRLWGKGVAENESSTRTKFLLGIHNYVKVLVNALGQLPFLEKKLCVTTENTFETVSTPSQRSERQQQSRGAAQAPLHHLFALLSTVPSEMQDDEQLSEAFVSVFDLFLAGKSLKARTDLTRELLTLLPPNSLCPAGPWKLVAQTYRLQLASGDTDVPPSSDKVYGPEYREIVSHLERGQACHPNLDLRSWFSLFDHLSDHIHRRVGDGGRALALVEPVAKMFVDKFVRGSLSSASLEIANKLLEVSRMPRDRQALDSARRLLWGAPAASRGGQTDPFDYLYRFHNILLRELYEKASLTTEQNQFTALLSSTSTFLLSSFHITGTSALTSLHDGLCPWIQDEDVRLTGGDEALSLEEFRHFWQQICSALVTLKDLGAAQLDAIEPLLTAAFQSKHRSIVTITAETWNAIFKDQEQVHCSDSFRTMLSSLRSRVDLELPGLDFSSSDGDDFGAQVTSFAESQDHDGPEIPSAASSKVGSRVTRTSRRSSPAVVQSSMVTRHAKEQLQKQQDKQHGRVSKKQRTPNRKLRHEDSQITFEPIATSSPIPGETQHLTDRQREVRDRQRGAAGLFHETSVDTPSLSQESTPKNDCGSFVADSALRPNATPEPAASYGALLNLTPTPRRGQMLNIDGYNDPPSSPPEPRPYPLLIEIQSRSRSGSSLANWEFSSPTGSPVTSHQLAAHVEEPPHVSLSMDSSQPVGHDHGEERIGNVSHISQSFDVIPSSAPLIKEENDIAVTDPAQLIEETQDNVVGAAPVTPPRRSQRLGGSQAQPSPPSGEDEFMDAKSEIERSSPAPMTHAIKGAKNTPQTSHSSFGISDGDESSLLRMVVAVEKNALGTRSSPRTRLSTPRNKRSSQVAHESKANDVATHDSPETSVGRMRTRSQVIPLSPAEGLEDSTRSKRKGRKRKQEPTPQTESGRKRRRSTESPTKRIVPSLPSAEGSQISNDADSSLDTTRRLRSQRPNATRKRRRSSRHGQVQEEIVEDEPAPDDTRSLEKAVISDEAVRDSIDNTDEEIMSQLVSESFAASHGRSESPAQDIAMGTAGQEDVDEAGHQDQKTDAEESVAVPVELIKEQLRNGLKTLQEASLDRGEVYEIEDILMDIKRALYEAEQRSRAS